LVGSCDQKNGTEKIPLLQCVKPLKKSCPYNASTHIQLPHIKFLFGMRD
jgi:hypothetical protein